MASNAWVYLKNDDVRDLGEDKAPWLVGWREPYGRRKSKTCGAGKEGKKIAERLARKITAELMTGTYEQKTTVLWDDFVAEHDRRTLEGREYNTRKAALISLAHFKRIIKPVRVFAIDAGHVDDFTAARRKEPGTKKGSFASPATINHDLRHIRQPRPTTHPRRAEAGQRVGIHRQGSPLPHGEGAEEARALHDPRALRRHLRRMPARPRAPRPALPCLGLVEGTADTLVHDRLAHRRRPGAAPCRPRP
jgi:hypothetical protein